jgi:hypothetical protein
VNTTHRCRRSVFCASVFFLIPAISLGAQTQTREISVAVGVMQYDVSGTGTAPMIALRTAVPFVRSWLLGEVSLSYASLDEQFSTVGTRVGVAEGQVQVQWPAARVRPYLGLGGGLLHYFNNAGGGRVATSPTISGGVGLRLGLSPRVGVRGELRSRTWGRGGGSSFFDSAAEWTVGLAYTF